MSHSALPSMGRLFVQKRATYAEHPAEQQPQLFNISNPPTSGVTPFVLQPNHSVTNFFNTGSQGEQEAKHRANDLKE